MQVTLPVYRNWYLQNLAWQKTIIGWFKYLAFFIWSDTALYAYFHQDLESAFTGTSGR